MLMCSQIFPFVRAQTQGGVCLLNEKTREREEKKFKNTHTQKFFEIFHEITQNVQLTVVTKRAFSLSLSVHHHREKEDERVLQQRRFLMTTSGGGGRVIARRRL